MKNKSTTLQGLTTLLLMSSTIALAMIVTVIALV